MHKYYHTLITGASEGFGKALALECAQRKMNLVLVALPESGLPNLAQFIRTCFHVDVYVIEKDLSEKQAVYELFYELLAQDIHINILINNAGIGGTLPFTKADPGLLEKQIKTNVLATTLITRLFVNELRKAGKSYILNVSSLSNFFYLPNKCVYGSTKSYIYYFSKSLRKEMKPLGISVSVVCPGGMNTNPELILLNRFSNWIAKASTMKPETAAPITIDGMLKGKELIIPGIVNKIYKVFNYLLPASLKNILTNYEMKHLHSHVIINGSKHELPEKKVSSS